MNSHILPTKSYEAEEEEAKHDSSSIHDKGWWANPRIAGVLMLFTYLVAGVGLGLSMHGALDHHPHLLSIGCFLAVGISGLLSFIRHSIFHRSDAIRMGWDLGGKRNNFQIEVGVANLAWGLVAILAFVCHWGSHVEAATFLVFGFYLSATTILLTLQRFFEQDAPSRPLGPHIAMGSYGAVLVATGIIAMHRL